MYILGKEAIKLKSFLMKISWFFIGAEVKYRVSLWLTNEKEKGRITLVKKEVLKIRQSVII